MLTLTEPLSAHREQVRDFLMSNFYVPETTVLNANDSLLEQGVIDSTGVLEVIGFIEETFGITVEDSELVPENLDSIEGIVRYVARKKSRMLVDD